tara:strand:+ start:8237 stop:8710 length:474 start_codon:yes stop_codon:yes gene_type:complete
MNNFNENTPPEIDSQNSESSTSESRVANSNSKIEEAGEREEITPELNKTDICIQRLAIASSVIIVIAGWFLVIWSYFDSPDFAVSQKSWFQRSGAVLVAIALYAEVIFNGERMRLQMKGIDLLALKRYRLTHFLVFSVTLIIATLIWGYGDLFHGKI